MSTAHTKTKKSTASKPKAASKSKAAAKTTSHPPFAEIIRECIADTGDRTGVSRPTIKKYIEEKYKLEVNASVTSNINRAIAYGAEKGTFVLPKGPSGKVKLAPKNRTSDSAKENTKPTKPSVPAKKTVTSKATSKPAPKVVKKTPTAAKKTKKPAASAKKPAAKRPAKKSITGTTKAKPAASKKATTKKKSSSATAPASKRKATSSAKPTSKAASAKPASAKK